jgi:dUTP pyrophosphatase
MKVKIKKLHENAVIPKYATAGSACFDLTAVSMNVVEDKGYGYVEYDTGLAFEIPEGYLGEIYPRSSISKTGMILANSVGIVDCDYRGSVTVRFKYIKGADMYKVGDRCCQMMIVRGEPAVFEEVTELSETDRGNGGYGSTGK